MSFDHSSRCPSGADTAGLLHEDADALRLIKPGGRLLLLTTCEQQAVDTIARELASWCRDAGLRLSPPRAIPAKDPRWLLAVATRLETQSEAA
ncbi:MAG: hypothetical protein IIC62_06405 [Proteobacteria bacterium]|nr:hypothetical protein [Pseudomonadota bacterium]